jgi:hypothetical protein
MDEHFTGLLEDTRSPLEKEKDYLADEVLSAYAMPSWKEKKPTEWKHFPIFDQDGSGSCVAQAVTKALGIENAQEEGDFVHLSARDIYTQRANKPSAGMIFTNAMDIACKKGATLEPLMPSQKKNEVAMNDDKDRKNHKSQVALVYKAGGYVQLPFDIDAIASILDGGNPVLMGFQFNYAEWKDIPVMQEARPIKLRHAVCAVDYALYKGKKYLVIEDSWGEFGQFAGQRLISEEFLTQRCIFAGYFLDLVNTWREQEKPTRPTANFTASMKFGDRSVEIKTLQDILKYEELFPTNVDSTGYYGSITAKAVLGFQKRYNLPATDGKRIDFATLSKLNEVY